MRFEVLGPLTVRTDDGTPVPVPEAKVRALLAALLVRDGRPVPVDRLIEDLWGEAGDAAPGNPGNTLQTKVSQLRRTLAKAEDGARSLVAYGPAGYALRAPARAVDADCFTELAAAARKEAEPRARAELLTRALGLWQGRPTPTSGTPASRRRRSPGWRNSGSPRTKTWPRPASNSANTSSSRTSWPAPPRPTRCASGCAAARCGRCTAPAAKARPSPSTRTCASSSPRNSASTPEPNSRPCTRPSCARTPRWARPRGRARRSGRPGGPGVRGGRAYGDGRAHGDGRAYGGGGNLPTPVSSLVGREEAVARVCAALGAGRLVTLCGPGGVGKTRLALAAAARLEEAHPDGVWFVELAGTQGTSVAEAVAAAIGMREDDAGGGSVEERLAETLRRRAALLVLDNCEHLLPAAAALAERLLRRAPGLRVLATSQEPLALSGEVIEAVAPLAQAQAVELFAARAAAAAPGFALGPATAEAVALICRRLDGIPLALELAATRVRVLGVQALAERLHDRFRLLNQVRRDAPARQRTLRATIDWSWELLSPAEATVLRRLSVFAGGFTVEAAEAVCADEDPRGGGSGDPVARDDVLDLLTRLVDCSLVASAYGDSAYGGSAYGGSAYGDSRLRLLESVAAYGLERLDAAGETRATRQRHAEYYTGFAERAAARLHGPGQGEWLRRLDREGLNARAALEHTGAGELALRLVGAQSWYWFLRGRIQEATEATRAAGATALHAAFALLGGDDSHLGGDFSAADLRGQWLLTYARCGFGSGVREDEVTLSPPGSAKAATDGAKRSRCSPSRRGPCTTATWRNCAATRRRRPRCSPNSGTAGASCRPRSSSASSPR